MRAVAVRSFGARPELMELPVPSPGPREILVGIESAGMNPYDWKVLDGILRPRPHGFPLIAGVAAAGPVVEVGRAVERFRTGDRVFGQFLHDPVGTGTYAEFAPVPEGIGIARIPQGLTSAQAAALPTAGMTALDAIERLALPAGGSLVIVGASGGVGSFATQLAAARGREVIAVARASSADRLRALGARSVLDRTEPGWDRSLRDSRPEGFDGLLDVMSDRATFPRLVPLVRPGGRAATTVYAAAPDLVPPPGVEVVTIDLQPSTRLLERLSEEFQSRRLPVPVGREIALEEAPKALDEIRAGRASGKTVIALSARPGQ